MKCVGSKDASWEQTLQLDGGETMLLSEPDVVDSYRGRNTKGILVLTNRRILFLKTSMFSRDYPITDSVALENILQVVPYKSRNDVLDLKMTPNHFIKIQVGGDERRDFRKFGIHRIIQQLNDAISARKDVVERESRSKHQPSSAYPPSVIREREVQVVVKIPCRYCGVLNDQLRSKCESCGAPMR